MAFHSIYDGSRHVFTPERSIAEQQSLGSDIIMCFASVPGTAGPAEVRTAVERTSRWAGALQARPPRCGRRRHRWSADAARDLTGGVDAGLRRESACRLREIGFPRMR